mgnify:CR=1 FL=1
MSWKLYKNCKECGAKELLDDKYQKKYVKKVYSNICSKCGKEAFVNSVKDVLDPSTRIQQLKKHIKFLVLTVKRRKKQNELDYNFKRILRESHPEIYDEIVDKL